MRGALAAAPWPEAGETGSGSRLCCRGCFGVGAAVARLPGYAGSGTAETARLDLAPDRQPQWRERVGSPTDPQRNRIAKAQHTEQRSARRCRFAPGAAYCQLRPASCSVRRTIGAEKGQHNRSLAQGFLQQAQRPRRREERLELRARGTILPGCVAARQPHSGSRATPMARPRGREPVAVEEADSGRDGLGVPSSDLVGGSRVARAISNGQERWERSTCAAGALVRGSGGSATGAHPT